MNRLPSFSLLRQLSSTRTTTRRRCFSTTLTCSDQSTWDLFDPTTSLAPATTIREEPTTRRVPRNPPRPKNKKKNKDKLLPLLPPVSVETLQELNPTHLSQLRLDFLKIHPRTPTEQDLTKYLPQWLRMKHGLAEKEERMRLAKVERDKNLKEKLDLAWEWKRMKEEELGLERSQEDLKKDVKVRKRLERRREEKRLEAERKDRERWNSILERGESTTSKEQIGEDGQSNREHQPEWRKHQQTLREKFPQGWAPPKRISREAMDLLRTLHRSDPTFHTVSMLADKFKISPEAVRRVLKSRFELDGREREKRESRRKEEREKMVRGGAGGGGAGLSIGEGEEVKARWSGEKSKERIEMERLRMVSEGV